MSNSAGSESMLREVDILIKGGTALTLSPERDTIEDCCIAVKDDRITFIGDARNGKDPFQAREIIHAQDCVIMPGLINAHTHAAMVCFRGLADDLPLMDWLNNYIFPAESLNVDEELVYYGTLLACVEMIKSGTTTFCDGYFFENQAVRAVKEVGMRAVLAQGIVDLPTPDVKDPEMNLQIAEEFLLSNADHSTISPALFCHAAYTCSSKTLKQVKELTLNHGVPYLIHLSESKGEVEQIKNEYGMTPVFYLKDIGVLDRNLIADHCVCLTDDEMDILKECGVKVVHNPESNMKMASGIAPIPELMSRGIPVGLGTDGCASNNDLDMFQEMDTAAKLHKVMHADPTVMNAKEVVEMATVGSAGVLGLDNTVGRLEIGKKADIIIIDMNKPHLTPLYNIYSHLVYAVSGADVITTIINGKLIMKDRKVLAIDEESVKREVNRIAGKIKKSLN
ncbi:MAG: amidohydrolase [Thermodesulfobacteriota bacterium]|nr:amidohydrolase [Thermodesulfobacteriota bacterium]